MISHVVLFRPKASLSADERGELIACLERAVSGIPTIRRTSIGKRAVISGEVPSALRPPPGCRFHPRCPMAMEVCRTDDPALEDLGGGRVVACHLHKAAPAKSVPIVPVAPVASAAVL